jgi:hypothetical protein
VEVELEGQWFNAPRTQLSLASFYFWQDGIRTKFFEYGISHGDMLDQWNFDLRRITGSEIPPNVYPLVQRVSYDFLTNTITGNCVVGEGGSAMEPTHCLNGTFDPGKLLSFSLNDTRTNTVYDLEAANKEWFYGDDAPNVKLQRVLPDGTLGRAAITTAVTKVHHCNWLKVCLAMESGVDMIAPIGILLLKLDDYGIYCTRPGPYAFYI